MAGQYLTFDIDNTSYAINVFNIQEVIEYTEPQTIPCSTPLLIGIIRLRDTNITLMDIRQKFNLLPCEISKESRIIILDIFNPFSDHKDYYGIIADSVKDVISIEDTELEKVPDSKNLSGGEFISSVISIDGKYTFVIDIEKLFSQKELNKANKDKNKEKRRAK